MSDNTCGLCHGAKGTWFLGSYMACPFCNGPKTKIQSLKIDIETPEGTTPEMIAAQLKNWAKEKGYEIKFVGIKKPTAK